MRLLWTRPKLDQLTRHNGMAGSKTRLKTKEAQNKDSKSATTTTATTQ